MELLAVLRRSQALGFLGPGSIEQQLAHATGYREWLPDQGRVLDLGSGGGLPGLVLLLDRPDLGWTLLDANERRCAFLRWAVRELGATAEVVTGRAEELAHHHDRRGAFRVVVARSFGPPAVTAELARAFLEDGGHLVVSEPPRQREDDWPAAGLANLGFDGGRVFTGSTGTYRVVTVVGDVPPALPRSERRIRQRPWSARST